MCIFLAAVARFRWLLFISKVLIQVFFISFFRFSWVFHEFVHLINTQKYVPNNNRQSELPAIYVNQVYTYLSTFKKENVFVFNFSSFLSFVLSLSPLSLFLFLDRFISVCKASVGVQNSTIKNIVRRCHDSPIVLCGVLFCCVFFFFFFLYPSQI